MANHKRGKPKSGRAGCLMCKPWKRQGHSKSLEHVSLKRAKIKAQQDIRETTCG